MPLKQSPAAARCSAIQVLDQLTLLVDKSLVVADDSRGRTRYRLLETVRQYALEKLGESGEADAVRSRHRDYYTAMAAAIDVLAGSDYEQRLDQAEMEIDNLRAAFVWSRENSDVELALALASSLQALWLARGRVREGLTWFDTVLNRGGRTGRRGGGRGARPGAGRQSDARHSHGRCRQRWIGRSDALALAREIEDPAVLARALATCGFAAAYNAELAGAYFAEAIELARELDDKWRLSQILTWQASAANRRRRPDRGARGRPGRTRPRRRYR